MESVSDSFKKAIKSNTREVKGYVEVVYKEVDNSSYSLTEYPKILDISLPTEIVDGVKKNKKYATLEDNYTELDGSFLLPNYNIVGDANGYVSSEIFSNIDSAVVKIISEDKMIDTSGITIYFEDNIAQKFSILLTDDLGNTITEQIENNTKEIFQLCFNEERKIKSLEISIEKMEYANRRIRIAEIDLGLSQIYEGNDLVSFTTNEEIDLLLTSTPINDCKVNLNNYDNSFDPINPTGLVKYLTADCTIKPYLGVLTTENGIEYIKMGCYYLKDWTNDIDGNVTLNGQSLMSILATTDLKTKGDLLRNNMTNFNFITNYLNDCYDYKFSIDLPYIYNMLRINSYNLLENLKILCLCMLRKDSKRKFFVSRDNVVTFDKLNQEEVETISRRELLEEVDFKNKTPIQKVTIIGNNGQDSTSNYENGKEIVNAKYILTKPTEYVWYVHEGATENSKGYNYVYKGDSFSFKYSSINSKAKAEIVDMNCYMVCIKFSGTIGDEISILLKDWVANNPLRESKNIFTRDVENGDNLEIDVKNALTFSNEFSDMANYFFDSNKKYEITAKYQGDPSLIPGDTISLETKYGFKNIIITKHELTFDGGLQGIIKGVGD